MKKKKKIWAKGAKIVSKATITYKVFETNSSFHVKYRTTEKV